MLIMQPSRKEGIDGIFVGVEDGTKGTYGRTYERR